MEAVSDRSSTLPVWVDRPIDPRHGPLGESAELLRKLVRGLMAMGLVFRSLFRLSSSSSRSTGFGAGTRSSREQDVGRVRP
jgi:hypothetical protein